MDGVHIGDVKLVDGDWRLAGESGYALIVTGSGVTVAEARQQMYSRINNIMLQSMFYRTDIGMCWAHDSDKLQTWGYLYLATGLITAFSPEATFVEVPNTISTYEFLTQTKKNVVMKITRKKNPLTNARGSFF